MVALLMELGADPLAVDGMGHTAASYATTPSIDRPVMETIRAMTSAELLSAERGHRQPRAGMMDLVALLALGDWETSARLVRTNPELIGSAGALHLMAKRNDVDAVKWLLDHGADPNARWDHWEAEVTPLHLAAMQGHADVVRALLNGGADPRLRDNRHDGDAIGWAEHFKQRGIAQLLESYTPSTHAPHASTLPRTP